MTNEEKSIVQDRIVSEIPQFPNGQLILAHVILLLPNTS